MSWGIVGTGAMAARFAVACRAAGVPLAAVAARDPAKGAAFAKSFGLARVVADCATLAALPEVTRVYIATPNARHVPDCLASIAAGTPVLCEKPLAPTAAEAATVAAAARAAGVFCMEAMWSLCLPNYIDAFAAIRAGAIGELREIQGSFATPQDPATMPRLFARDGGGALLDRGVYLLALSQALLGPLTLRAAHGDLSEDGVDLSSTLILTSGTGARAVLSCAIDRLGDNSLTLWGSTGRIRFAEPVSNPPGWTLTTTDPKRPFIGPAGYPDPAARLKAALTQQPRLRAMVQGLRGTRGRPGGLEHQIRHVEACLAANRTESDLVPLAGSVAVLALVDAARTRLAGTG
jgi:predicted dehydrogenase